MLLLHKCVFLSIPVHLYTVVHIMSGTILKQKKTAACNSSNSSSSTESFPERNEHEKYLFVCE